MRKEPGEIKLKRTGCVIVSLNPRARMGVGV